MSAGLPWWHGTVSTPPPPTPAEEKLRTTEEAFLRVCVELGISAGPLAYLDAREIARRAKLYERALALGELK